MGPKARTSLFIQQVRPFNRPRGRALRVGLTGGIGAGKSTVAKCWAAMGATVVDADHLARQVVEPGSPGLAALVAALGEGILSDDGGLDRAKLAKVVFDNEEARRILESVTHPLIAAAKEREFAALAPHQVGVYDVPLLAEKKMAGDFDVVVVVEAPCGARLARLEKRGVSRAEAERRMATQATGQERRGVAHLLINNAGTLEDLRRAAQTVGRDQLGLPGRCETPTDSAAPPARTQTLETE